MNAIPSPIRPAIGFATAPDPNLRLTNRATLSYSVALAFIALLSVTVHFLLDGVIAQQRDSGTLINVAGRQRMLSQRIAMLSADLSAGDKSAEMPLSEATLLMEQSHRAIRNANDLGISTPLSAQARSRFEVGPEALDTLVPAFIAAARRVLDNPRSDSAAKDVADIHGAARSHLLPALNDLVVLFTTDAEARIARLGNIQLIVLVILLVTLGAEAMFIFRPLVARLHQHASKLTELASRDYLTGLLNRRAFTEAGAREVTLARRTAIPASLLVLDLDHFKQVNDTYGHAVGDAVLKRFAQIASSMLRQTDIVGRIGGEEFAILLPGASAVAARTIANKLRLAVALDAPQDMPTITVSIGVASVTADDSVEQILARADRALYDAKHAGRNRVVVAKS